MSLLSKQQNEIENKYIKVWDIIEILSQDGFNSWIEIATFLGHHDFDTNIALYTIDRFYKVYSMDFDFEPIRNLIEELTSIWLENESEDQVLFKMKYKYGKYYWLKEDIFNFKPLIDLNLNGFKESVNYVDKPEITKDDITIKNYKFYLFKQPLLNSTECACIASEQNPAGIVDLDKFCMAQNLIYSAIKSGDLKEVNHSIDADDLRIYLFDSEIIIKGFNEDIKSISDNEKRNLKNKIKELEKIIVDKDSLINELKTVKQHEESSLLEQIFDHSRKDSYAPDLALSIKLWESVYITNPNNNDRHSNKANIWLKRNTDYDVEKSVGSASKIREITSPLTSWSPQRDKKFQK